MFDIIPGTSCTPQIVCVGCAKASGTALRRTFADGIRHDHDPVLNRLKVHKRHLYGRANFDLLRKRVLLAPDAANKGGSTATPVPDHRQVCFEVTKMVTVAPWARTAD
jgi:hypothetical protein